MVIGFRSCGIIVGSSLSFQNCGQPGSIQVQDNSEKSTPGELRPVSQKLSVGEDSEKVDILIVIDNSNSIRFEMADMAERCSSGHLR
jgi:hypothetical protein